MTTDRFVIFGGPIYYPSGGWDDVLKAFDTLVAAQDWATHWMMEEGVLHWAHILDRDKGEVAMRLDFAYDGKALQWSDGAGQPLSTIPLITETMP